MDTRGPKPDKKTLSQAGSGDLYHKAFEPIRDKISIYDGPTRFLQQLIEINREQGLLYAANWCTSEVCNGGFHQFFSNPTGVLAPEAIRGFDLIGAESHSRIVRQATAMLGSPYPRDTGHRQAALESLMPSEMKDEDMGPFAALDRDFYEQGGSSWFATKADDFVLRHLELFFK